MNLPIFFYPTTFIFIDDDEFFLRAIKNITFDHNKIVAFSDVKKCLHLVESVETGLKDTSYLLEHVSNDYEFTPSCSLVNINFPSLHKLMSQKHKNNHISCIIADYNMPGMNGIEFFSKLKAFPFKKILLTGTADYREATNAFNNNLIDRFIRKDAASLEYELQHHLSQLSKKYFIDRTSHILAHLESKNKSHLTDPTFCDFFYKLCIDNEIKEFTLIDKAGCFLLIDGNENELILAVYNETQLEDFVKFNCDESTDYEYIEQIKSKKKIPFFGIGREGWEFESEVWKKYLYTASIVEGRETYYYSLI